MDINITNPVTTSKIGEVVNGASAATPNDTDLVPIVESSVTKKLTLTNLKAFLKTYFDTLYTNLGYTAENVANKSDSYTLSSSTTYASTKAVVDGLATKQASGTYATGTGSANGTNTGDETTSTIGVLINGSTAATPNDTDLVATAESSVLKKITWTNVKAFLKTYFDTIYTTTSAVATQITTALSGYLTSATAASTYAPIASPTFTGTATTPAIIVSSETASRVAIIDASKNVKSADTATYPSLTELAYVKGVTSSIQTQLAALSRPVFQYYSDSSTQNPGDGGIFYSGTVNNYAVESGNGYKFISPKTNCVFFVTVNIFVRGTLASSETTTIKLQNVTAATEQTLNSIGHDKRINSCNTTTSLANTAGDEMIIQGTNPSWATNPTTVHYQFIILGY